MAADKVTFREMISQWQQYPVDKSGYIPSSNPISNKSLVRDLLDIRADEIRTATNAGIILSEFMFQTPPCVKLIEQDRAECVCAAPSGCYWLKTKDSIPRFIKIVSVTGGVAGEENPRFSFIKWDRFQYIPDAKNISVRNGNFWTIRETHEGPFMYLYGNRFLEEISITAIWEDPIAVEQFSNCDEVNIQALCNPLDCDFRTDAWLRKLIIAKSWQTLIAAQSVAISDTKNDDKFGGQQLPTRQG